MRSPSIREPTAKLIDARELAGRDVSNPQHARHLLTNSCTRLGVCPNNHASQVRGEGTEVVGREVGGRAPARVRVLRAPLDIPLEVSKLAPIDASARVSVRSGHFSPAKPFGVSREPDRRRPPSHVASPQSEPGIASTAELPISPIPMRRMQACSGTSIATVRRSGANAQKLGGRASVNAPESTSRTIIGPPSCLACPDTRITESSSAQVNGSPPRRTLPSPNAVLPRELVSTTVRRSEGTSTSTISPSFALDPSV